MDALTDKRGRPADGSVRKRLIDVAEGVAVAAAQADVLVAHTDGRDREIAVNVCRALGRLSKFVEDLAAGQLGLQPRLRLTPA